ncbi:MAG: MFS transporter [Gracilibacteraceae bacterium]|nr:MFS transporter [Gracilibacteraceae bacterium]
MQDPKDLDLKPGEKSKKTAMLVVAGAFLMMFFANGITLATAGNYLVSVSTEFGVPISTISFYLTVQSLVMTCMIPFMGRMMALGNPRLVATISIVFQVVGYCLFSVWSAPWGFYISGALIGIGGACICFVATPLFINSWFRVNVGTYLGIVTIAPSVGQVIFNPICTNLIAAVGWRTTYLILGGIAAVGILTCALFLRNSPESYNLSAYGTETTDGHSPPALSGMIPGNVYRSTLFIPLIITTFILGYCVSVVTTMVPFVVTSGALTLAQAGLVGTVAAASMMVGKLVMGKMYDKFKIAPVTLFYTILQCIGFVLCVAVYTNTAFLFPAVVIMGIGIGGTGTITMPMVARILYGPKHYSQFYPKFTIAMGLATALSGFMNNYIYDVTGTYASIFYIMAAASVVGGLIIVYAQSQQAKILSQWDAPAPVKQ